MAGCCSESGQCRRGDGSPGPRCRGNAPAGSETQPKAKMAAVAVLIIEEGADGGESGAASPLLTADAGS